MITKTKDIEVLECFDTSESEGDYDEGSRASKKKKTRTKKDQAEFDQQQFRRGIGLEKPPAYQIRVLKLDQLIVPDELRVNVRLTHGFARNVSLVGVLHPPAVVVQTDDGSRGSSASVGCYKVVIGRRRVCAAREAGLTELTCHVYASDLTPAQEATIRLSENMRRSSYVAGEVLDLARLLQTQLVSEKELAWRLGFCQVTVKKRLKMAQLPQPLLDALRDGELSVQLAEQISRLPGSQQLDLASRVTEGELLSVERVQALQQERKTASFANLSYGEGRLFGFGSTETETARAKVGLEGEVEVGQSAATLAALTTLGPESWSATSPVIVGNAAEGAISVAECRDKLSQVLCFANAAQGRAAHQVSLLVRAALLELDNLADKL